MAVQVIDIGDILTRVEVFVAINFITMGFIKVSVLFYGTVLGLAQVFNLSSYRPIITVISTVDSFIISVFEACRYMFYTFCYSSAILKFTKN